MQGYEGGNTGTNNGQRGQFAIMTFTPLLGVFGFRHISREVGETRMKQMLFGTSVEIPEDGR